MVGIITLIIKKEWVLYSRTFCHCAYGLTAFFVMLALTVGVAVPMLVSRKQSVKRLGGDSWLQQDSKQQDESKSGAQAH